jgi:hypothetical protein
MPDHTLATGGVIHSKFHMPIEEFHAEKLRRVDIESVFQ